MDDGVEVLTATVYRAAGRRYLSKRAAFTALARKQLRDEEGCERGRYRGDPDWDAPACSCSVCSYDAPAIRARAEMLLRGQTPTPEAG